MRKYHAILTDIISLKCCYYRFDEWGIEKPTRPNPGATSAELAECASKLRATLPPEYADLLGEANGWVNICVSTSLLSTFQIVGEYGAFAQKRASEILGVPEARLLPVAVSDPEFQRFSCIVWILSETAVPVLTEVDEFGEKLEFSSISNMLIRFRDSLESRASPTQVDV